MEISTNRYGKEKRFTELVLYISSKLSNDQFLGGVKLNKVLYFSDFTAFGLLGRTITGMEYQHLPEGPAPRAMYPIQQRMVQSGILVIEPKRVFNYIQNRPLAKRAADMSYFSDQEISIVDKWIERLRPLTGSQVADLSHDTFGWRTTEDGETIDPRTVFIAWKKPTSADIKRGQELAQKYGLSACRRPCMAGISDAPTAPSATKPTAQRQCARRNGSEAMCKSANKVECGAWQSLSIPRNDRIEDVRTRSGP